MTRALARSLSRSRALAAVVVAGTLFAGLAHANGVNLSWSSCYGEGQGTQNRTFACDTNNGGEVLVCSFVLDEPIAQVNGNEIVIDLLSVDDPLPAWWEFKDTGTCRQNSLSVNFAANPNDLVCVDWGAGKMSGGIGSYGTDMGTIDPALFSRHRRLKIALAVPPAEPVDLVPNTEYFACNIVINHQKTIGAGACSGCDGAVCLLFTSIHVTTLVQGTDRMFWGGTSPGSDRAQWQGAAGDLCDPLPVKRTTWGQVKGLYR